MNRAREAVEAKKRQVVAGETYGRGKVPEKLPEAIKDRTRESAEQAGAMSAPLGKI